MYAKFYLTALLAVGATLSAYAQTTDKISPLDKEVGIRLTSLSDFGLIYKWEKAPDRYHRVRLASANLSFVDLNGASAANAGLSVAYGVEKRRPLGASFLFVHGWEPTLFLQATAVEEGTSVLQTGVGLGYLIGFQYNVSKRFYVGLELIPAARASLLLTGEDQSGITFNAGLNSNAAALTLLYRFRRD